MCRERESPRESHETNSCSERQAWLVRRQGEAWGVMGQVLELLLLNSQAKNKEVTHGLNNWLTVQDRQNVHSVILVPGHCNAVMMCNYKGKCEIANTHTHPYDSVQVCHAHMLGSLNCLGNLVLMLQKYIKLNFEIFPAKTKNLLINKNLMKIFRIKCMNRCGYLLLYL